ncbi:MAG: hypothetical protein JKY43_04550 [Phycisphaerales bacterium]|nr:hypothetical protein [Phycisphaerales bacterium]
MISDAEIEVYYSIKANPAVGVCRVICEAGVDGAEIASSGELIAAMASGFDAGRVLFAGPGKTDGELEHAIGEGVGQINAESVGEIGRIDAVAGRLGVVQRVGIRVNLEDGDSGHGKIRTGGGAQKFGIDESQVVEAIGLIEGLDNVEFAGLHTMLGSQVLDADVMLESCGLGIEMAIRVSAASGVDMKSFNFGGGLGVSHFDDEVGFDVVGFGEGLKGLIGEARKNGALSETKFVIEPGRVLVSEFGVYVSRVVDVKESCGETFAILDGGIHHALLPITANSYRVVIADRVDAGGCEAVMLGGPLCTSADQWRSSVELPGVKVGDVVAMMNSGAYGLTASMNMFLSRGTPVEVLVIGGECLVIRERSTAESVLDGQCISESLE